MILFRSMELFAVSQLRSEAGAIQLRRGWCATNVISGPPNVFPNVSPNVFPNVSPNVFLNVSPNVFPNVSPKIFCA